MPLINKKFGRRLSAAIFSPVFIPSACVGFALALTGSTAFAQLITEDFSYPNGALIGQNGGTGWSSAWFATFNTSATNTNVINGRLVLDATTTEQPQRNISTVLWPTNGSSAYLSFSLRLENPVAQGASMGLNVVTFGSLAWGMGVFNNTLQLQGSSTQVSNFFTPGTDYQFVLRLTRNDAVPDTAALWVNPTSEANTPLITGAQAGYLFSGATAPTSLSIASGAGTFSYDNIRLGTAFGQVVPEPGTTVLLFVAGGIFAGGFRRHRGRVVKNQRV